MATAIERLYKLSVDGNQAIAQLNKIADSTSSVDKQLQSFAKGFKDFKNTVLAGFSVGVVVAGFKSIVDSMSEIVDSSQKLGVTTDELQKLRFAAQQSGVSAEALDTGIKKLSIGLTQIEDQSSEAAKQLRALGVTSKDTVGSALEKIADQFQKAGDGAKKTAVAAQAFGKAGNQLIPMLNDGAKGLKDFAEEAEKLGLIVDGQTLGLFDKFGDQMDKLKRVLGSVGIQIAGGMLPALTAIADAFVEAAKDGETFSGIGKSIGEAVIFFAGLFIKARATVVAFAEGLGAVAAALVAFFSGNFAGAKAVLVEWADSTDKAGAAADATVKKLEASFKKYTEEGVKPTTKAHKELTDSTVAVDEAFKKLILTLKEQAMIDAARRKSQAEINALLLQGKAVASSITDNFGLQNIVLGEVTDQLSDYRKAMLAAQQASIDWNKDQNKLATDYQIYLELLQTGTAAQQAFARAMLETIDASRKNGEELKKVIGPLDIVQDNFKSFFKNLESGTANASELFKRMVQSIIAQLLRLAAQKAILSAFGIDIGLAKGGAIQNGKIVRRYAKGAILNSPVLFPMSGGLGQAGEAGAEGVFPLARTSSGDLGVKGISPTVEVNVINNANAEIEIRQSDDGTRVDVIVERARRAVASDIRSGGSLVSSAIESTYALGRARGG